MHSPFVYAFIKNVLNNRKGFVPPIAIEALRRQLKKNKTVLPLVELGAGSRTGNNPTKTIAQIAASALKPPQWGQLLFRTAAYFQPQTIIELGTSLGLTTAYLAAANNAATVYTIEGNPYVQQQATQNFQSLQLNNIQSVTGSFDEQLPLLLKDTSTVDLAYIDGNHRRDPTLHYFHQLLQKKGNDSIFIFDDIHWSAEMEEAWDGIKRHPAVTCSIDLFFMGFVFFRPEFKTPQQFCIRTPFLF